VIPIITCIICGYEKSTFSLPLKKEDGLWVARPICGKCRRGLIAEAQEAGGYIKIYKLDASIREASHRNAQNGRFLPFLESFAQAQKSENRSDRKDRTDRPKRKRSVA